MNFDTKYLIRWGIPGWVFMFLIGIPSFLLLIQNELIQIKFDITKILGVIVSLAFLGVTLGYIMQQIYFSFRWSGKKDVIEDAVKLVDDFDKHIKEAGIKEGQRNNVENYYVFEYIWHRELVRLDEDQRNYIAERYRHILSTIHSLGALRISIFLSLIANIILFICFNVKCYFNSLIGVQFYLFSFLSYVLYLLIIGLLLWIVSKGFNHYSSNMNAFQGYFLNELINIKKIESKRDSE
ncbi:MULTISPECIES: BA5345 family protein [Bacillus amyloliquefaciens group]|uniref:hypothetical protein n=1 Tax=Bacillus amyloliquefaciens group TaxID=1938374 RepID=UPI0003D64BA3|nr:hypothetical protein [Bacillus amyloliquefaciens]AHC42415.1 hypothetical protein U722_09955 [Bacillus amyloliquefaciens LFB112]